MKLPSAKSHSVYKNFGKEFLGACRRPYCWGNNIVDFNNCIVSKLDTMINNSALCGVHTIDCPSRRLRNTPTQVRPRAVCMCVTPEAGGIQHYAITVLYYTRWYFYLRIITTKLLAS
ncbi:hypothetical protein B5X24_HaOG215025 [Helicoverpa armigera]|uniref:Uncharacterized protein n=1 Tax=Helicoverpa armigera TaxID=29058 RepID=A0A2W1B0X9_HELAM|nr:hypothetical protein B5X24_HaOG215025 [Helicoverpa armigera]